MSLAKKIIRWVLVEGLIAVVGAVLFLYLCGMAEQHVEAMAERDRQQQLVALCSADWPTGENTQLARTRACGKI